MDKKLKIKKTKETENFPCEHDTRLMVDLLAGEIKDKGRETLSDQLDNCEECRNSLAELSNTWNLTAEVLKSDIALTEKDQVEASTAVPEEAEETDTNSKSDKPQRSLKSVDPKKPFTFLKEKVTKTMEEKSGFKFAFGEIAASIIVVFIAVLIYGGTQFDRIQSVFAGAASSFGSDDAEDSVSSNSVDILKSLEADGSFEGSENNEESPSYLSNNNRGRKKPDDKEKSSNWYSADKQKADTYESTIHDVTAILEVDSPALNGKDYDKSLDTIKTKIRGQKQEFEQTKVDLKRSEQELSEAKMTLEEMVGTVEQRDKEVARLNKLLNVYLPKESSNQSVDMAKMRRSKEESKKVLNEPVEMDEDLDDIEPLPGEEWDDNSASGEGEGDVLIGKSGGRKEQALFKYGASSKTLKEKGQTKVRKDGGDLGLLMDGVPEKPASVPADPSSVMRPGNSGVYPEKTGKNADRPIIDNRNEPVGGKVVKGGRTSNYTVSGEKRRDFRRRRDELEKKLVRDPYNSEAMEELKKIYKDKIRDERTSEVQWKWSEPVLPDVRENSKTHRDNTILFAQGKQLQEQQLLHQAREKYEKVLLKDPYNKDAVEKIKDLTKKIYKSGKQRYDMTLEERDAESVWTGVSPLIPRSLEPEKGKGVSGISKTESKLDEIEIEHLEFEDATIPAVVKALRFESKQMDRDKEGVNIILRLPEHRQKIAEKTVTVLYDDMSLEEAVKSFCIAADLKYRVEDHGVVITHKDVKQDSYETLAPDPMKQEETIERMESLILPGLTFEDADFSSIIKFIKSESKRLDKKGVGINIAVGLDEAQLMEIPPVTMKRKNIPIDELIREVCRKCNLKYQVGENSINITHGKNRTSKEIKTLSVPLYATEFNFLGGSVKELKRYFKERGIDQIKGSIFKYDSENRKLIVRNNSENLRRIQEIIAKTRLTLEELNNLENGLPFIVTKQKPTSTFSIDVDTASYTRCAKEIREGKRPSSNSVRPEEFVNYFDYHYRSPSKRMFGVYLEAAPCPFRPLNTTFRIGVQGKRLGSDLKRPSAFTILIDTSGSMANKNRLDLVKRSLPIMLSKLRNTDKISIIACGSETTKILPLTSVINKKKIMYAVNRIEPQGVTDLEKGIVQAYQTAANDYVAGAYNRVILFTDGISNISIASAEEILEKVDSSRKMGISNTVVSVGGDGDDTFLEALANKGDGNYVFIEDDESAKDLFENQFAARFREIARDVKIQVEFNDTFVSKYRQIGYQNRQLSKADFRNDAVDAGEVGAGQSVTALYEMKLNHDLIVPMTRKSRPQILPPPIAIVRIRYKRADNMQIEEFEYPLYHNDIRRRNQKTTPNFQLACAVAEFAEDLRFPEAAGIASLNTIRKNLQPLMVGTYKNDAKVKELDEIVRLAK